MQAQSVSMYKEGLFSSSDLDVFFLCLHNLERVTQSSGKGINLI